MRNIDIPIELMATEYQYIIREFSVFFRGHLPDQVRRKRIRHGPHISGQNYCCCHLLESTSRQLVPISRAIASPIGLT